MGTYVEKLKELEKKIDIEKEGITITVSGSSGSGKTTVSTALADEFELVHMNVGDIFRKLAKANNVDIADFAAIREKDVDIKADEETLQLAKKGGIVLNGRLTAWVAGDNADVKVFVKCNIDEKAKRVAGRDKKSVEEAKKDLEQRDKEDNEQYMELYGINTHDLDIYNIVVDNSKVTPKDLKKITIDLVKEHLKKKGLY
jgi:cytidylate kinase